MQPLNPNTMMDRMREHVRRFGVVIGSVIVSACGGGEGGSDPAADTGPPPPSLTALAETSLALSSLDSTTVQLVEGGAETDVGARIALLAAYSAEGDFDGDGVDETAALVVVEPGGTGVFMNLVAFRSGPDGEPVQVSDRLIGDRQQIHRFESVADSLLVELTTQGPGDAMCCPTRRAQQVYLIRDGEWRLWRDNTLSAAPPDIQDGVQRRDSTVAPSGPRRGGQSSAQ